MRLHGAMTDLLLQLTVLHSYSENLRLVVLLHLVCSMAEFGLLAKIMCFLSWCLVT